MTAMQKNSLLRRQGASGLDRRMWKIYLFVVLLCNCVDGQNYVDKKFSEARKDCQAAASAGLAFSEIMVSSAPLPGADYIELFNPSATDIELTGIVVTIEGDGARSIVIGFEDDEIAVDAGGYWVMAGTTHKLRPSFAEFGYGDALGALPESGAIVLLCDGQPLDRVRWEQSDPRSSLQLSADVFPTPMSNDQSQDWCYSPRQYTSGRYGSPGALNAVCFESSRLCRDDYGNYRPKTRPSIGDLVISEVMANPNAVDDQRGEWFEVYARSSVDFNDVVVVSNESSGMPMGFEECLHLSEGSRAVFARSSATVARLPKVDHVFDTSLVNTGDRLSLEIDGQELDSVSWSTPTPGVSSGLDPNHRTIDGNDLPQNWCLGRSTMSNGDMASPGRLNSDC